MKHGIRKFIPLVAIAFIVSGCAQLGNLQSLAGKAAERQCEKEQWRRSIDRLLGYVALDGKGVPALHCPGDPQYQAAKEAAPVALSIFDALTSGNVIKAYESLNELAIKQGFPAGELVDSDGCITNARGWRVCLPPKPLE